ncbi:MAG: hypothetical protein J0L57_01575 [Burkholderiales bacterium]|nr:hypothetical protein [Burkholderiales bacterium]
MNVYLTFDVEVWCNGWSRLDENFPSSFERYVYGRSPEGQYALPRTLEILNAHGLVGVFFVEPLFSARFGACHLEQITRLILDAGQDVQMHLHPEWTDEIRPRIIADADRKRQHLTYYTPEEQVTLIAFGRWLLESAMQRPIGAFRAGSFAANRDLYRSLLANDIAIDSSLNACNDYSSGTLESVRPWNGRCVVDGIDCYPVTVLRDGFGRARHAQVGACSFQELSGALLDAEAMGCCDFVIVSHNFEMLKPGSSLPDHIVEGRFDRLCAFLAAHSDRFRVGRFPPPGGSERRPPRPPAASAWATAVRHGEQLARRVLR